MNRAHALRGRQSSEAIFHVATRTTICPKLNASVPSQGRMHQKPTRPPTITAQANTKRRRGTGRSVVAVSGYACRGAFMTCIWKQPEPSHDYDCAGTRSKTRRCRRTDTGNAKRATRPPEYHPEPMTLKRNPLLGRAYSRPWGDRQARAASSDRAPRTASVIVPGSGTDCTATKPCATAFESSKKPTTVPEPLIPAARVPRPRRGRRAS